MAENSIRWYKLLSLFICFFMYLFLGAAIFHYLETENETRVRSTLQDAKQELRDEDCLDEDELEEFIDHVKRAVAHGIDPSRNASNPSNWDYASAFYFSGTVVTTIGYGKLVPKTDVGRNVCLLYALFGIPFTGWLLATIGNFYCEYFHKMSGIIEDFIHNQCRFKHRRLRKGALYVVIFVISYCLIVLLPSVVLMIMENWPFEIAHYYSFITLSTIGFGDYVASVDSHHPRNQQFLWIYDIAVACWYVFGLAYLAVVITAIGKHQKHTLTKMRTAVQNRLGKDDREPPIAMIVVDADSVKNEEHKDAGNKANNKAAVSSKQHQCLCHQPHKMVKEEATQTD
ncbi:potassium channel, subfamily K, member 16-like [Amphiura filiformis]|uniref:potassium channel, subfamily K, member 16-like n=1 Tax=Amphiura filiformis TaxID=82378 RepID=UPI003B210FA4